MDRTSVVNPQDRELRALLGEARTIAVVGLSSKTNRPSFAVAVTVVAPPSEPNATHSPRAGSMVHGLMSMRGPMPGSRTQAAPSHDHESG